MQSLFSNGPKPRMTSHPFAPYEPTLRLHFQSSLPCSIDTPEVKALHQTAVNAATGICRRIGFEPYREQATLAVYLWRRELQGNIPQSFDTSRPLYPFVYRALTFIIYRMAREAGFRPASKKKLAPQPRKSALTTNDPAYVAQLNELPELVATLPDTDRTIIVMRFFDDRTTKEIADILDLTRNAVRLRIHRAIRHLRCIFGEC